jgi:outer membrane protein
MIRKWLKPSLLILGLSIGINTTYAQEKEGKVISVDELFSLVKENHPSLKVYQSDIEIAKQNVEVAKNQMLPEISVGLQGYYLGDAHVIDKDFSNATRVDMPNFGNKFSVEARQLIWKGGAVRNAIAIQDLRKDLAKLNYDGNELNIKILVLGYYMDLYKLYNQVAVYEKNIELAEQRLANIRKFNDQGMVTKNDVIRGELQLSNLKLALNVVNNNQDIINKQLTVALGLDSDVKIVPDTNILNFSKQVEPLMYYMDAISNHPTIRMVEKSVNIYETAEKISRSEMMPALSAFGGNTLQRPITSSSPAVDMYTNGWSAGLSLNFNVDALFKAPKKVQLNRIEHEKARHQVDEVNQMLEVGVNAAFIKYHESLTQNNTLKVNKDLSEENYRIMESKYNNHLAILLDLIDASNAKLDAELQYANSEINIAFSYYKLQKESGLL